jgi:alpha-L-fucosidase 2
MELTLKRFRAVGFGAWLRAADLRSAAFMLGILFLAQFVHAQVSPNLQNQLWYQEPAQKWTEALPIGNGRMGAMIFGGTTDERIQFNEDTLWKGKPHDYVRAGASNYLQEIRELLFAGKTKEAETVVRSNFLSDPVRQKAYQPFGDLRFHFPGLTNVTDYRRGLDLDSGVVWVTYRANGVQFRREASASLHEQTIMVRLTADRPGQISFTLKMDSPHTNSSTTAIASDTLALKGQVEEGGLKFESRIRAINAGGRLEAKEGEISVDKADSVTLLLVAATSFKNFQDISGDPEKQCEAVLSKLSKKTYDELSVRYAEDYLLHFLGVTLDLGRSANADLPTNKRLEAVRKQGLEVDPALAALYFRYGQYLMVASSRPGGQPANLQGLWNEELNPPWESKWTLNINCEMNYWPVEVCNLSECAEPLFSMIDDLAVSGAQAAKEQYGARGWVVHHNTDIWRGAAPINNIDGVWPTGGAWLCYHLWEHYLFTGDTNFLARAYPDLKGASQFFVDYLVKDPKTGWLVTSPSFSPEQGEECYGPTMDNQLIRALMNATIEAAGILGKDKEFAAELAQKRDQLPPNQIGRHGQLQEWLEDKDVPNNNHRHMSPLWAMYPGADITPADAKMWDAAKVLLKWRGAGSTGWSYAWRIPLWARAGDGESAFGQLSGLLQKRTLPNLFDLCGPFQIDGNFGATAGIAEMLLQSQWTTNSGAKTERIINLLPALPNAWPKGSVSGLKARDGFTVEMEWDGKVLKKAVIRSYLGKPCVVRYGDREIELPAKRWQQFVLDGMLKVVSSEFLIRE